MKKIVSAFLVCVLLIGSMLALVSCGGISGTYHDLAGKTALKFSGSKFTAYLVADEETAVTGTYEIVENDEGEAEKIKFTVDDGDDENVSLFEFLGQGEIALDIYEKDGKEYIKLAYVFVYVKQ